MNSNNLLALLIIGVLVAIAVEWRAQK